MNPTEKESRMNRIVPVLAVSLAACLLTVAAAAATRTQLKPQNITMTFVTINGKNKPVHVVASGPISGTATETQTEKNTATGQINYATLHFANGTVRFKAPEAFAWLPNLKTCSAIAKGGGTFTITGGTGAFKRATGKGTFTDRGTLLGARSASGQCLGPKTHAPPKRITLTITMTGNAAVPSS
jgi:hypothetical protein